MGLLNRILGSYESIAKEIQIDDQLIAKHWKEYLSTIPKKKELIEGLRSDSGLSRKSQELRALLKLELADIQSEESEESELLADLRSIEHSQKVKRVQRLEQCLAYVDTKVVYIHRLLIELFHILRLETNLAEKLITAPHDIPGLMQELANQFSLEMEVLKQIERVQTFHELFSALVKGEHIIREMDSKEKRLLKTMQKRMNDIFSDQVKEGVTYEWTMTVFSGIQEKVEEGISKGILEGYHYDVDFEYVNRPEFVDYARETIERLTKRTLLRVVKGTIQPPRERKITEQMITTFVNVFREWFNQR